ncbi:embryonic protein UVS.2-like [Pyxicephalus adspersus]|uniref:embryonic protein UVS.2-like n=1 Tax=Pyxicephalus adspersus TaxID=30357 RepID=UPI003B598D63
MIMGICIFQLLCCIGFIACAPLNLKTEPVLPFSTKAPDLDTFGSLPLVNPESEVDIFTNILKVNQDSKNNEYPVTQGDIILPKPGRMATTCTRCLWPKSVDGIVYVPYTIAPKGFTASNMETIRRAMLEYETLTCIRFVNRTKEKDFLTISYSSSCTSFIGRIGGGQVVQLNPDGCLYQGSIQHELHHALGFYHEVSRPDRDEHILVKTEFIDPSYLNQFAIFDGNTLDLPYDYNSVMHYSRYAFTINASVPVLIPIPDPNVPIGQRIGLSVLDIQKVNKLYKCDVPCSTLLNGESGTFTSNNFPSQYPNNMSCTWLIRVPRGQAALTFNYINIQETDECVSDYIRIYDGPTKNHPVLLDKACGTPNLPMIIASTYHMLIEFVSDNSVPSAGFNASYKSGII